MAKETVYCPRCAKNDVKTIAALDGESKVETAEILTSGKPNYGTFGVRSRRRLYEQYIPIYHHCKNCGHIFLSLETNEQELQRSILNRNSAIWATIFWGIIGFLLVITGEIAGILFGICALAVAVLGIVNAVNSIKAILELRQYLEELQDAQQKKRSVF